jgi:hypothetical protein
MMQGNSVYKLKTNRPLIDSKSRFKTDCAPAEFRTTTERPLLRDIGLELQWGGFPFWTDTACPFPVEPDRGQGWTAVAMPGSEDGVGRQRWYPSDPNGNVGEMAALQK